jgi:hypothetical protein
MGLSNMPQVTGVPLFLEELHAVFLIQFLKEFPDHSQIPYSFIKLITFDVNP